MKNSFKFFWYICIKLVIFIKLFLLIFIKTRFFFYFKVRIFYASNIANSLQKWNRMIINVFTSLQCLLLDVSFSLFSAQHHCVLSATFLSPLTSISDCIIMVCIVCHVDILCLFLRYNRFIWFLSFLGLGTVQRNVYKIYVKTWKWVAYF